MVQIKEGKIEDNDDCADIKQIYWASPVFFRGRKSLLFTVMVLLIAGSILIATISFVDRSQEINFMINSNFVTYKIANIKADIAQDYLTIMGLNGTRAYVSNGSAVANLSFMLSESLPDNTLFLSEYSEYIKDEYSPRINIFITPDLRPYFEIYPYETECSITPTLFSADMPNPTSVLLEVLGQLSSAESKLLSSHTDTDSGTTPLTVLLKDIDSKTLVDQTYLVDLEGENQIDLVFNTTVSNLSSYSRFTINLSESRLTASINGSLSAKMHISLMFNSSEKNKIYLKTGNNSVFRSGPGNISIDGPLELISG